MFGDTQVSNARFENYSTCGTASLKDVVCTYRLSCSGTVDIDSSQLNRVNTAGSAQLTRSHAQEVRSSGSLQATDCSLGSIQSSGSTTLARCIDIGDISAAGGFDMTASKVHGKVVLSGGEATIKDCKLSGGLECAEQTVHIENSSVDRILVKPIISYAVSFFGLKWSAECSDQKIILKGKDCRIGSIVFEDGAKGCVILRNGAAVGNVQGARIVRES